MGLFSALTATNLKLHGPLHIEEFHNPSDNATKRTLLKPKGEKKPWWEIAARLRGFSSHTSEKLAPCDTLV